MSAGVEFDATLYLGNMKSYRSMFRESNWLFELPFLIAKVLRRLTGIRELPGILGVCFQIQLMSLEGTYVLI